MIPSAEFSSMEAAVFARYALSPKICHLSLAKPKLALRAYEIGKGEPILFMHGITLAAACWASLLAKLPSSHSIAIDMPGHGGSEGTDHSKGDLRRFYTQMILSCLDELGTRSAHLVGHSYGAMFALWLALDSPERARSVVVVGTPSVAFGAHPDLMFRILSLRGIGPAMLSTPSPLFIYRRMLAASLGPHAIAIMPPEVIRTSYLGMRRTGFAGTVSTYLREQFRGMNSRPQRYVLQDEELKQIRKPVLILWGEEDDRYQSIAEGRERAALIPNARFAVVPGGHAPWLDDVAACSREIEAFLARHHNISARP
ncbi:MAG TPA: alpha/beta hydrolase [Stellaceae bacterium]|nr:alpha/beta hydrolase [Stellaceae bacterium]